MSTQTIERLDPDLVEAPDDAPRIAHCYCGICNRLGQVGAVLVARCGHSEVEDGRPAHLWWPADHQVCSVCEDVRRAPCPRCFR